MGSNEEKDRLPCGSAETSFGLERVTTQTDSRSGQDKSGCVRSGHLEATNHSQIG